MKAHFPPPPSVLRLFAPPGAARPSDAELRARLPRTGPIPASEARATSVAGPAGAEAGVWLDIDLADAQKAKDSPWSARVELPLRDVPVIAFHAQLKLATALVPDAVVLLDENARAYRAGAWARDAAAAQAPLPPTELFTLHVSPGGTNAPLAWIHTHGLPRFGLPEFELFDVPEAEVGAAVGLLQAWAALFLDGEGSEAGQPTRVSPGVAPIWVSGDGGNAAVQKTRARCGAAGSPFAVIRPPSGQSLAQLLEAAGASSTFYRSKAEGVRASLLAQERLSHFRELYRAHGTQPGWRFLLKVAIGKEHGLPQVEHLWFAVQRLESETFRGMLLNTPVGGGALQPGSEGSYALSEVSDWRVDGPMGEMTPENVLRVSREASAGARN